MAKRFTDTTKWDDDWYLGLPPKIKCAWDYLCDNCDGTGVLKISLSLISFRIGETITKEDLNIHFGERIFWISEDKLWVVGFIAFQYKTLSIKNHAHRGIMANIIRLVDGLPLNDRQMTLIRGWKESLLTLKEKEKEKEKENSEKRYGEKPISDSEKFENRFKFDLPALFVDYPRQQKKAQSLALLSEVVRDEETYDQVKRAIDAYRRHCVRQETKYQYILTFPNWWVEWRDWLDPNHGAPQDAWPDLSHIPWTGPEGAA